MKTWDENSMKTIWDPACRDAGLDPTKYRYTLSEAARVVGVSPATLRVWARQGRFPTYRVGPQSWFVLASDLLEFLRACRVGTAESAQADG